MHDPYISMLYRCAVQHHSLDLPVHPVTLVVLAKQRFPVQSEVPRQLRFLPCPLELPVSGAVEDGTYLKGCEFAWKPDCQLIMGMLLLGKGQTRKRSAASPECFSHGSVLFDARDLTYPGPESRSLDSSLGELSIMLADTSRGIGR